MHPHDTQKAAKGTKKHSQDWKLFEAAHGKVLRCIDIYEKNTAAHLSMAPRCREWILAAFYGFTIIKVSYFDTLSLSFTMIDVYTQGEEDHGCRNEFSVT